METWGGYWNILRADSSLWGLMNNTNKTNEDKQPQWDDPLIPSGIYVLKYKLLHLMLFYRHK